MIPSLLAPGECRVWWATPGDRTVETLSAVLSDPELERAARFRRDPDRRRFLTGAWLLRTAAATQLGVRPEDVVVDRSCSDCNRHHGKPYIRTSGRRLHVSVSHSGDRVAVAMTSVGALGVDVEAVPSTPVDDLARCALTPGELRAMDALPPMERHEAFAKFWTRKEAALKATGHGLRVSPDKLEVSRPEEAPRLLSWPLEIPPGNLRFVDLDPGEGYVAVVALIAGAQRVNVVESQVTDWQPTPFLPQPARSCVPQAV
ncbi:4'-phosphopantetheinyl transferase [Sphaerisporangium album]|uniref:4'-phosphopantetheinyl transferase n=1 Tax=Sphaerisporangium album TaxID=509200 RepID=A0A367FL84_9ACTN|nr:4'-phosphopantetheinyl transferase superfamily protein [Sphaerisporangium album]RCG31156.1 4'-phosphopantetheinyl transferase [Sphaerisporangium album]